MTDRILGFIPRKAEEIHDLSVEGQKSSLVAGGTTLATTASPEAAAVVGGGTFLLSSAARAISGIVIRHRETNR